MLFHVIVSIFPTFACLFGAILLLADKKPNLPKRYLAVFLFISMINYLVHAMYFTHEYKLYAFFDNVWVFTSLAGYPLYYYYIRLLTCDKKINWVILLQLLLPAILLSIFSFVNYYYMTQEDLETFVYGIMYHSDGFLSGEKSLPVRLQELRIILFKIVFAIQVVLYVILGIKLIIIYNRKLGDFYSNTSGKHLHIFKWILIVFLFASIISFISNLLGKDYFIDNDFLLIIPSFTHTLFLSFIIYVGYKQDFTFSEFVRDLETADAETERQQEVIKEFDAQTRTIKDKATDYKEENSPALIKIASKDIVTKLDGLSRKSSELPIEEIESSYAELLTILMEQSKLFKNSDLRISDLAYLLRTNRSYLSNIINKQFNTNFNNWVNDYRVCHAIELMTDPEKKEYSLVEIAEQSGFASQSTFYAVFKQGKGISPGKFRENLSKCVQC